jgi:hypothetical protein
MDGRVSLEEPVVVGLHPRDLGLLEHELGHDDVIGIPGVTPGKVAAVPAVPSQQATPEGDGLPRALGPRLRTHAERRYVRPAGRAIRLSAISYQR